MMVFAIVVCAFGPPAKAKTPADVNREFKAFQAMTTACSICKGTGKTKGGRGFRGFDGGDVVVTRSSESTFSGGALSHWSGASSIETTCNGCLGSHKALKIEDGPSDERMRRRAESASKAIAKIHSIIDAMWTDGEPAKLSQDWINKLAFVGRVAGGSFPKELNQACATDDRPIGSPVLFVSEAVNPKATPGGVTYALRNPRQSVLVSTTKDVKRGDLLIVLGVIESRDKHSISIREVARINQDGMPQLAKAKTKAMDDRKKKAKTSAKR